MISKQLKNKNFRLIALLYIDVNSLNKIETNWIYCKVDQVEFLSRMQKYSLFDYFIQYLCNSSYY